MRSSRGRYRTGTLPGVLVLAGAIVGGPLQSADWPQFRGPNRDGISAETALVTDWSQGLKPMWRAALGTGASSIATAAGKAYSLGNQKDEDVVWCLDSKTGTPKWSHRYPCKLGRRQFEGGPAATPTVDSKLVFTLSHEGQLLCLDAADGKLRWAKSLIEDFHGRRPRWGYAASPLVIGQMLIVGPGGRGSAVVALNKQTGELLWKGGSEGASYSAPALAKLGGVDTILMFGAARLSGFQAGDGRELWSHPWKTDYDINAASPIVLGDRVMIASGYNSGSALLEIGPQGVREVWRNKEYSNQFSSGVLWKGTVYGFNSDQVGRRRDNALCALDSETGKILWQQEGWGSLIAVAGKLLILTEGGELVAVDPDPGQYRELARAQLLRGRNWSAPAFSDGVLYARSNDGEMVAVRLAPAP